MVVNFIYKGKIFKLAVHLFLNIMKPQAKNILNKHKVNKNKVFE